MKVNGVNLGQGVCNLPVPAYVLEQAAAAAAEGINRYTNPRGLVSLRHAVANKLALFNKLEADPETEILITCGATGAFEAVCASLLNPGDEVVILEPSYPYHVTALKRYQAKINFVTLSAPNWDVDWDAVKAAITPKTKFILINTPGNPTGKIFTREELETLAGIMDGTNCMVVTDEIYEYMTFDGASHLSPATVPGLAGRTITIGGFSKTFSITGWRIGYMVAPKELAVHLTSVLDAIYVCPPAPLQEAVARSINHFGENFYHELNAKYEAKRNMFAENLFKLGFSPLTPNGAYYMICSYENHFPGMHSTEFVSKMIANTGVGAVPATDFVRDHENARWVRFCLANEDEVLEDAINRLSNWQP